MEKSMEEQKEKKPLGCVAYVIAGMSFIPLIGVLFGISAIIMGVVKQNMKVLFLGVAGILSTVFAFGALYYFGAIKDGGIYDDLREKASKSQMTSIIQFLEIYKVQNGSYPESLEILKEKIPKNTGVSIFDPTQKTEEKHYFYKKIDENHYHIRALGKDGLFGTKDDILPERIDKAGLKYDYNP